MAKSGWNSAQWNRRYGLEELRAHTVIISLGSNDYAGIQTEAELRAIRANARADRVYWILPAIKPNIQEIVRRVATDWGDTVLPITGLQPDRVHPSWEGYKQIAKATN
jgi:lysophospholipase L1-like esterase